MIKDHLFDIILKSFGIYCFIRAITQSTMLFVSYFIQPETYFNFFTSKSPYLLSQLPFPLLHFILSYVFLFQTQSIIKIISVKGDESVFSEKSKIKDFLNYSFCIKILGLYYFVKSSSAIAARAVELVIQDNTFGYLYSDGSFIANLFISLLAILFVFKSKNIERFITKNERNTQHHN